MDLTEQFQKEVYGPLSYEEVYDRSLAFIEAQGLSEASVEIMYIAKEVMAYGVWVKGHSGWWVFKKRFFFSCLFGVRLGDRQDNILGYEADIETKTSYGRERRWFKPVVIKIKTNFIRSVGMKTKDGMVTKAKPIVLENGEPAILLHT